MISPYDRLGITPDATPTQLKAAYHAKLREFPAHTHPEEFKAIRSAYDAIRDGQTANANDDFLQIRPIEVSFDPEQLQQLRQKVLSQLAISVDDLIREMF
ncbi:MAG: molecular chaperone DnaJ [Kovacikia sp.]